MKEIEIKAHVYNSQEVIDILNKNAYILGKSEKQDTYYHLPLSTPASDKKNYISVRIRKETTDTTRYYLTYKQKELIKQIDGTSIEVNDENETEIQNPAALEKLFASLGGKIALKKQKSVIHWNCEIEGIKTHIELCTIPPLGDFLEIESIQESDDPQLVEKIKKVEESIFTMCNIPLSQIEPRYYSELLK